MRSIYLMLLFLISTMPALSQAALNIELTQGVSGALPIAIVPFTVKGQKPPTDILKVINNDLENSGRISVLDTSEITQYPKHPNEVNYSYWRKMDANDLILGAIQQTNEDEYKIDITLLDLFKNQNTKTESPVILNQTFTAKTKQLRRLAHHISDLLYQQLTGQRGIFSTRIAYVLVKRSVGQPTEYSLEIADADGHNPKPILISNQPIMSPAWSPDGKKLAYVSFEKEHSQIYITDIRNGQRQLISDYPGINGAPAWSPDGKKLSFVLSKSGSPQIYVYHLSTGSLKQVTRDLAINTEPSWSKDGKDIVFTSNRGGAPQIYQVSVQTSKTQRLTFSGNYNARASYSPSGDSIVMLHRNGGLFNIAVQDLETGTVRSLTQAGLDESPSFAPNGDMILYASQYGGRGVLGVVSRDGRVKLRLPARDGNVQEPAWSPFLG